MGILYGPNAGQSNQSRFDHPEFNRLFAQAARIPDGPEREALYRQMNRILFAFAPLRPTVTPIETGLAHAWVVGYRKHPVLREFWKFVDIDDGAAARR
jgi:ABC-type transport system substrate-binding protein